MGKIGDLFVQIGADAGAFNKELKQFSKGVDALGQTLKKSGKDITASVTLPIAGFGIAALRASKEASGAFASFGDRMTSIMGKIGDEIFDALDLGDFLTGLGNVVDAAVDSFSRLPGWLKTTAIATAALTASIGPLIFLTGQLITTIGSGAKALELFNKVTTYLTAHPLVALAATVAAAAVAFGIFSTAASGSEGSTRGYADEVERATNKLDAHREALRKLTAERDSHAEELTAAREQLEKYQALAEKNPDAGLAFAVKMLAFELAELERKYGDTAVALQTQEIRSAAVAAAYTEYGAALEIINKEFALNGDAMARNESQTQALLDLRKKLLPIYEAESEELQLNTKALSMLAAERAKLSDNTLVKAQEKFAESMRDVADAQTLGLPGFNAINAQLQARIDLYRQASESGKVSEEKLAAQAARITELQGPLAQLQGHIQAITITAADFVIGTFDQISQGIGNAVSQILVYGANAKEVFKDLGKQILSTVISTIIQIGIQRLVLAVLSIGAAALETVAMMGDYAALTYAAAFASTAAIPIVGPLIAAGVAAGAVAAMLAGAVGAKALGTAAGAGIGGAAEGGIFTQPSLISVSEPGVGPEIVLNRENISKYFPELMGAGGGRMVIQNILDGRMLSETMLQYQPGILRLNGVVV